MTAAFTAEQVQAAVATPVAQACLALICAEAHRGRADAAAVRQLADHLGRELIRFDEGEGETRTEDDRRLEYLKDQLRDILCDEDALVEPITQPQYFTTVGDAGVRELVVGTICAELEHRVLGFWDWQAEEIEAAREEAAERQAEARWEHMHGGGL